MRGAGVQPTGPGGRAASPRRVGLRPELRPEPRPELRPEEPLLGARWPHRAPGPGPWGSEIPASPFVYRPGPNSNDVRMDVPEL